MKFFLVLVPFVSAVALAEPTYDHCRLKVVSTSLRESGIMVTTIRYRDMDLATCVSLCKDESRLKNEIETGQLILSCRLKHQAADGTETRLRHRFRFRPTSDCP